MGRALTALAHHGRSLGEPPHAHLPSALARSDALAAALVSTDQDTDVIPICDARAVLESEWLALLAAARPKSGWVTAYRSAERRPGFALTSLPAMAQAERIPEQAAPPPALVVLQEMGIVASHRPLHGHTVKLLVMGNRARAGHTHEDKGSFVLEFAGQTFALDPGTCGYSNPLAGLLKHCERHSMLVPAGTDARPHPECPIPADVKPHAEGDDVRFSAAIDLSPGWEGWYRNWRRSWSSPDPSVLTIRDRLRACRRHRRRVVLADRAAGDGGRAADRDHRPARSRAARGPAGRAHPRGRAAAAGRRRAAPHRARHRRHVRHDRGHRSPGAAAVG